MKCLYFDLDGTIITENESKVKTALSNGKLEKLIIATQFGKIFFVGSIIECFKAQTNQDKKNDNLKMVFNLCDGAFFNQDWFIENVTLIENPAHRVREINIETDWWYIDDLAEYYCRIDGFQSLYKLHNGKRIFTPTPNDNGQTTVSWIKNIQSGSVTNGEPD
jgi:hypothetical protein